MKILSSFLLVFCTTSWADKINSPSHDLSRLFDFIPVGVEPYENNEYIERNYIGCLNREVDLYGVFSKDKRVCITLGEDNTLRKTKNFSELFPDFTSLSTSASQFINSNNNLNQSYWQVNNEAICYVQGQFGSQHSCLLPSNYSVERNQDNEAWSGKHGYCSHSNEGYENLQATVVGTGVFVVLTLTLINLVACQISRLKCCNEYHYF